MKSQKKDIIERFKEHPSDTGSCTIQIGLLSEQINRLTEHFRSNSKDFSSRRGYLKLIGTRRKLLNYLKESDIKKYNKIIEELSLNA